MQKRLLARGIKERLDFPHRQVFGNLSAKTIKYRQQKFTTFLNQLAGLTNLIDFPEACEFLGIEPHTRTLLSSLDFDGPGAPSEAGIVKSVSMPVMAKERCRGASEDLILSNGGKKEAMKIETFLHKVNKEPLSIANAVQEFEASYFGKGLKLSKNEIKLLLWGDATVKGLLYYCGDAQNVIGGGYCMDLLAKFIKYEYNSVEAEKFLTVFSTTEPDLIRKMGLDHYVKEIRSHDNAGLLALYYYLRYNTHGIGEAQEILSDKESVEEYQKWLKNKVTCGTSVVHDHR